MRQTAAMALATASALALIQPALAQEAEGQPTPPETGLDAGEIVVTARRREESLQEVPLVVNAVTSETLEKLNIRNFQEITSVVPGLQLTANANGIGTTSSLRGVNHDVNVSGENGTIQYYRQDAPAPSSFVFQTMYDIGQIEVLRGPQGTLRGRSTPSGSITITSRRPDLDEAGGYMMGTLGSDALRNVNGALNIPILRDVFGVRIAGLHRFDRGSRVESLNNPVKPRQQTDSIRATARLEPFDFLRLGFMYESMQNKGLRYGQVQSFGLLDPTSVPSANAPNYGIIEPDDYLAIARQPSLTEQKFKFYNWNAELDFAGQRLIYVGSRTDQSYFALGAADTSNFFPAISPNQETRTGGPFKSHEIRLQNAERIAGMFDYVVGYFRYAGKSETILASRTIIQPRAGAPGIPGVLPAGTPLGGASITNTPIYLPPGTPVEESFFGNVTVHLGESTEISGGLRRIDFTDFRDGLFINCTPTQYQAGTCVRQNGTRTDTDEKQTIYNASVKHRFTEDLMVYAATGTSWRPPVIAIGNFTNAPYTPIEVRHVTLPSETSRSYEVGFKSNWFDRRLLLNVTAYHQKYKNYPFRSASGINFININTAGADSLGSFNFISAVPVKIHGVEAEIGYNPSQRFSLGATINYSKSKIGDALLACTDALNNATGAVGSDRIPDIRVPTVQEMRQAYGAERLAECPGGGQSATFQPEWSGSVRAEYNHPFAATTEGFVRSLVSWRGQSDNDPNNRFDDVGAYALVNLFAGVRDPGGAWEISGYVKNLFDTAKIVTRDDTPLTTSVTDVFLAPPTFRTPAGTGSTTFTSRYSSITVTAPREFGVTARFAFGSR